MTIEPMLFVSNLAWGINRISIDQMNVYKICRGFIFNLERLEFLSFLSFLEEKFNLTVEFCANIENNTEDPVYTAVEKEVKQKVKKGRRLKKLKIWSIGIFIIFFTPCLR